MTNHQFDCDRESQSTVQTKIRASTQVFSDRCFASCRCRSEDKKHEADMGRRAGGSARAPRTFHQRVAVRVSYSANKNPGQWKAHGRYVARESATQGGRAAEAGFNATDQNLDIATTLDNWQSAGDERLFKIIVSPEFADRLNLQAAHSRVDATDGTRPGHTTRMGRCRPSQHRASPRSHRCSRSGRRGKAASLATGIHSLGGCADGPKKSLPNPWAIAPRQHAQEAQRRETLQNRYTSLDRILQRSNDGSSSHFAVTANPNDESLSESAQLLQKHLAARLMHLQTMGLAQIVAPHEWRVQADFEKVLRTLQQSGDRQKMLAAHGALVSDKRLPLQVTTLRQLQSCGRPRTSPHRR